MTLWPCTSYTFKKLYMLYRYMLYTHFTIWAFVSVNTRNPFCFRTLNAVLEREAELQADYAPWLSGWPREQRTAPFHEPENHFSIRKNIHSNPWHDWTFQVVTLLVGHINLPQTMASLSIQRMGCWWFLCSHFRVNHYVTQIPISIDLHLDLEQFCWCSKYWDTIQQVHMGPYGIWKKWSSPPTSLFGPHRDPKTHHFLLEFVKSVPSLLSTICFPSRFREFQIWNGNLGFHIAI